jgi:hypothetical protein
MIEIKELIIKATVADGAPVENGAPTPGGVDTQKIVNLCVAEVLKVLKRENER